MVKDKQTREICTGNFIQVRNGRLTAIHVKGKKDHEYTREHRLTRGKR